MIRCFTILAICTALVWSFSCKQGEVGPRLGAVAGQDTSVQIGDTVYLDLSGSFGKDYDIEWSIISQPAIDTIAFSQSDSAYIIPSRNGLYTIQLRISRGNEFSEDFMSITVSGAIPLSGTITGDSTLTIINVGLETDYIVTSDLTVSGYLTIEEGVIIEFEEDVGLIITESGTLMAENATMKPTENQWKGIHLMGQGNVLANNLLVNGGSSSYTNEITEAAALILTGSAKASVSGNTFESSGSYGIVVKDQAGFVFDNPSYTYPFRNNKFKSSGLGPLKIPVTVLAKLSSPDFSEESEESYLMLYESTYPAAELVSANLSNYGIPFRISGTLKFDQPLSILPGTEVYFTRTGGIIINGNLNINGSSSDPVILDGFTGTPGSWNGIYVKNGNTLITYATITNAGYRTLEGLEELSCLTVEGTLNMQHCEVSHCNGIGIWLKDDAVIEYPANFYGNTVSNNKTCAVRLGLDDAYKLAKLAEVNYLPDSVRARHILLQINQNNARQMLELADSLKRLIEDKRADFAELARTNSVDGSAKDGGDLGWFRESDMVNIKQLSDSCFFGRAGDIKMVTTQFGIHIVEIFFL